MNETEHEILHVVNPASGLRHSRSELVSPSTSKQCNFTLTMTWCLFVALVCGIEQTGVRSTVDTGALGVSGGCRISNSLRGSTVRSSCVRAQ